MSAKKKAKKRLPKPVYGWAVIEEDGKIHGKECFDTRFDAKQWCRHTNVIRVRITPVAKRRKGAK